MDFKSLRTHVIRHNIIIVLTCIFYPVETVVHIHRPDLRIRCSNCGVCTRIKTHQIICTVQYYTYSIEWISDINI